jgi:hypothetical protein
MADKRILGSILASVIISVAISGGFSLVMLSMIQEDEGIVLQSVYTESNAAASISYENTTYQKIPDTEASITIQSNSKIAVTFNAMFMIVLGASYSGGCLYNISIVVNGYGNQSFSIVYLKDGTGTRIIPINFYVTFITDPLSAGTYLVEVYWKSYVNVNPDHALALNYVGGQYIDTTRSLWLLELA